MSDPRTSSQFDRHHYEYERQRAERAAAIQRLRDLPNAAVTSTSTKEQTNMPDPQVNHTSIRQKALSLMEAHPALNLPDASKRAEELLRIEFNEPRITTSEEWANASLAEQNEHLQNGWDIPESPGQLLFRDPDAFMAKYPDAPDTQVIREARRWEGLTDQQRAEEREAKRILARVAGDYQQAVYDEGQRQSGVQPTGVEERILATGASDRVMGTAVLLHRQAEAAKAASAAEPSVADLMKQADNDFVSALNGGG